jgi:hypothetical protein
MDLSNLTPDMKKNITNCCKNCKKIMETPTYVQFWDGHKARHDYRKEMRWKEM